MATSSSSSSSSSRNWVYDVFPSFSGEDIRKNFLSHFLKELDQKLIIVFKDNEIERGRSLDPELLKAIRNSRIAVVLFSKKYASSSWCLNELLVQCKKEFGQLVITVFYGLESSHVRKQTGDFGRIFGETCKNKTEELKNQWRKALTDVSNIAGYHFQNWDSEAPMIEKIVSDILGKLNLSPSNDFEGFVGLNDHITKMNSLLDLESEEVKMVGIWGASGIGKTTIARVLYSQLSGQFQGSIFIDRPFISKSLGSYSRANLNDHRMKLQLQKEFLSKLLNKKDIEVDHLGAVKEKLQHRKVLIVIDDLDDYVILETLADQTLWFGSGSRIIVVTNDKHLLNLHGIDCIYEVGLPSEELAIQILCQSAFKQNSPPTGFEKLVVEVARYAGSLPLGLIVLGSSLRGQDKEYWEMMLSRFQIHLDRRIEMILRISYDGLSEQDKALFRHIACLFNLEKESDIKLLLEDSILNVNLGLKRLVDMSLVHLRYNIVEMPPLLQKLGKAIVRQQSIDPGRREFLVDPRDICYVLEDETGTGRVLGISLDIDEIDELHIHENAFKKMRNLRFLKIFSNKYMPEEKVRLHLPDSFDYLPPKLRLLWWDRYPMKGFPSKFNPANLVKLKMENSKLEKLWEGIHNLKDLREINLWGSENQKEIPNLSMATKLEKFYLGNCLSWVEVPSSSIRWFNELTELGMLECRNLETLPTDINLESPKGLSLKECSRLCLEKLIDFVGEREFLIDSKNTCNVLEDTDIIEMHCLVEEMGKEIVLTQSNKPGKRQILIDSENIYNVLEDIIGTENVIGTSLDIDEFDESQNKEAFKGLPSFLSKVATQLLQNARLPNTADPAATRYLRFVKVNTDERIPSEFDFLNVLPRLRLLSWDAYPVRSLPSNFRPEILVELEMRGSKLDKLWDGFQSITGLRNMYLSRSEYLKELPDLSLAINLEEFDLSHCSSLVELPPSNLHLENLVDFRMRGMRETVQPLTLPLDMLPHLLERLFFSDIPSLVELPYSVQNFKKHEVLRITDCINLEILPTGINLHSLDYLNLRGCLRLKSFPNISTNISWLNLSQTGIEEVPWWIENFSNLIDLSMEGCNMLKGVSLNISKLEHLKKVNFSDCGALTTVDLSVNPSEVAMEANYIDTVHEKASSSLPDSCVPNVDFNFMDCFNLDQEALLQQQTVFFKSMIFSGEEVSSYFTHRTTGKSLTNIPLLQSSPSQPFFKLRACAIVDPESVSWIYYSFRIQVFCQFKDRLGNHFDSVDLSKYFEIIEHGSQLLVFDCCFTLNKDNTPLAELNCDHVDIQFHLVDYHSQLKLKGCGIRLLEDGPYLDDRPCNPFILPHVCEGDNNTRDNFGGSKSYKKSTRGDNFLGEVNSDATSNSRKSIEVKRVGLLKEENKHGKVRKSSTMVTYERHLPQHQVFINFWGEEVSFSFISHLVSALFREGVNIFIGKYEKRDEDLENSFRSIEDSNIALVIFSSTYTESRWCLEELVKIKERMDEDRIIPIFYKVEHSHVKELDGDFGLQFWNLWRVHRDHRIINWKDALESVASMKGVDMEDKSSESKFITSIVKEVLKRISLHEGENPSKFSTGKGEKNESFLNKCPLFGLGQRMKQLEQKLEFDCNETRIIGVVGMAGIGKTTLAMMLHEKWNCKFVRCVALLGIRKKMKDNIRPEWLQNTLFEVLLEGKCYTTHESLKDELLKTKVLVVLDDVSDKKQLEFLHSDLNWIKKGSKVVITVRDKSLIQEFVHDIYVVPPLNYGEAFQLFSDHVFHPTVTSMKLCREFVDCAGGNPLVIKLLGKQLHGRDEAQWEMRPRDLTQLGMVILNIFRFSFDELSDKHKDVFLDIACFFRLENDNFVRSLVDSGDYRSIDAESEVRDLTHKCMIAISGCRVEMHDLLYMFGKIFSSQALIEENGGKSRLWYTEEIIDALINQKDTKSIRGIFLDMSEVTKGMVLHRTTFINMINLRYLKIYDSYCPQPCKPLCKLRCSNELEFPLEEVRYLHWVKFPLKELPRDFKPKYLVDLRLPYSKIERVWEGVKDTPRLELVDLSHSSKLLNLSALSNAESLQRLNLESCTNLDEMPGEMKNMKSLVYLNMRGCIRLMSLPKMNLISLKTLILSDCSNLKEFQVISKSLEVLRLDGTAITGLPLDIQKLQRLVELNLKNCKMLECLPNCLGKLKVLEELILSGCSRLKNLPDVKQSMKHVQVLLLDGTAANEMPKISCFTGSQGQAFVDMLLQPSGSYPSEWPHGFDGVYSLRRLCLSGNDFASLQNDIGQLYNLTWLDVKHCKKLRSVPLLPPRLQYFDAHGCDSLEKVANPLALLVLTEQVHAIFNFSNCNKLDQDATDAIISYTRRRSHLMLSALSRYNGGFALEALTGTCFPGWEVPEWFSHRGSGSMLEPNLLPHWCGNRFTGIALCAVILFPGYHGQMNRLLVNCKCEFENEDGSIIHFSCIVGGWNKLSNTPRKMESSHVFIGYTSISKHGGYDEERCFCTKSSLEFQVTDGTEKVVDCEVLQCGFSLVNATNDRENICRDAKTMVVPKSIRNVSDEKESYDNCRRDDDIQYQSYSGPNQQRDENFITERKSDATQNLWKTFEEKRFELFKNAGGEVTISSNHHNKHTENVEKPSLVGVDLRLKQLEKVLYSTPGKTRIVGVVGMPGFGKTTLANILFEKRGCKFLHNFFLTVSKEDISEELKRMFLKESLEHITRKIREETTEESLKDNLLQTKVFVVLDNVSDMKQLEFLLGNLKWIKKGSKIIVTTCDKSLLEGLAHDTYVVPHLNKREAFQVFSYHAFDGKNCISTETFLSLTRMFVENSGGNPLALKLLGSELRGQDEVYWKHKLRTVTQNSKTKIQDVWRFYTDQLTKRHNDVLLDIACFFRSEDEYFIKSILDSGDPDFTDAVNEVRDLAEKFLITICDGRVEMNEQLYRFGKDFNSPGELRLWKYRDILDKLRRMEQQEANNVRGIFLDMSEVTQSIALERSTFINMRNLRYLKICESCCPGKGNPDCKLQFPDGIDFPLEEVRYFHWLKFPLEELPSDFRPKNLVDLRLPYSKVKRLWKGVKDTPKLKWVDLSHSSKLLNVSALSKAESLQRLNLEGCTDLDELPGEMKNMKSLVYLNMRGCTRLMSLPKMNLISLKTLILSDCSHLEEFHVISISLEVLHLDGTAITGLPLAIQNLQRLVVLNLKNCKMLEWLPNCLGKLKVLEELILSGCSRLKNLPDVRHSMKHVQSFLFDGAGVYEMLNISCFIGSEGNISVDMSFKDYRSYGNPSEWPRIVNKLSSLRHLCLSRNYFVSLQNDIGQLYNLIWLDVKQCKNLRSISMLPPRLQYFDAHGCDSLERIANPLALQVLTEQIHATFNFSNCNKLDQDATDAIISYTRWKSQLILDSLSRYNGGFTLEALIGTCFPGWEVPAWFSYRASGSLLELKLPPHWCDNRFTGIALSAVILFPSYQNQQKNLVVKCNFELKSEDGSRSRFSCHVGGLSEPGETIESSHVFIGYASKLDIKKLREDNKEGCIHTEASLTFQVTDGTKELEGCEVLKCGFSLVYASDDLQVNSDAYRSPVEVNQDIRSSCWVKDFFGYIFLAFSCLIVFAILSFGVIVFAPQHYLSFSDFCWSLFLRILFFVAFGLFLKQETRRENQS